MSEKYRREVIDNFIDYAIEDRNRAELFEIDHEGFVKTQLLGKKVRYRIICRSTKIDELFNRVVPLIVENPSSQGFLYFLHQEDNEKKVHPLYLGMARKKGKSNEISTLFEISNFPRWDYTKGGNYHLSGLNSVVFEIGYDVKDISKNKGTYIEWAKTIFQNTKFPVDQNEKLKLRERLYLSLIEWNVQDSFVNVLGNTSIKCEEAILISLLHEFYPNKLLNKDF